MRLKTLQIERFGHFTDKVLEFREGACLHVVHGANEAGKSCSLAAITDLFFKFEKKSEWDFLHPGRLSVGATVVGSDGSVLSFKRRKGSKYTLIDPAGAPLPEDSLDKYLGALTRETFSRAFGLSAKRLRRGAKEMLKSGGEVGASLFAAASGLRGLTELRTQLATEADGIFTPNRGSTRTFYQALKRHEDAVKEIKDREFRERELKDRMGAIEALTAELQTVRELRRSDDLLREQLERLCEVTPLLGTIAAKESALQAWAGLPDLSDNELAGLNNAYKAKLEAEKLLMDLVEQHNAACTYAGNFQIERALLAEDAAIQALQSQTGAHREKRGQIGGVRAEGDKLRRELEQMRLRLGLPVEAPLASLQPSDATALRIRKLLTKGRILQQAVQLNKESQEKEQGEMQRLNKSRAEAGAVEDPGSKRERLQRLMPVLSRLEEYEKLNRKQVAEQIRLAEAARAQSPPIAELDRLATVVLPDNRVVQDFVADWDEVIQAVAPLKRRVQEVVSAIQQARTRHDHLKPRRQSRRPAGLLMSVVFARRLGSCCG